MASIEIDLDDVLKRLGNVSDHLEDLSELFKAIGDLEKSSIQLRFEDGVNPDGKKWRDPRTIRRGDDPSVDYGKRKRITDPEDARKYFASSNFWGAPKGWHLFNSSMGDRPMMDTRNLLESIDWTIDKNELHIGSNIKYGKYLNDGDFRWLAINKQTEDNILISFKEVFEGIL